MIFMQRPEQRLSVFISNQNRFPNAEHSVFLLSHFKGCSLSRLNCGTLHCFLALGFASPSCQFNCMVASHWRLWQLSYSKLQTAS